MLCLLCAHAMACSGCHPPPCSNPNPLPSPPLKLLLLLVTQVHEHVPAPLVDKVGSDLDE